MRLETPLRLTEVEGDPGRLVEQSATASPGTLSSETSFADPSFVDFSFVDPTFVDSFELFHGKLNKLFSRVGESSFGDSPSADLFELAHRKLKKLCSPDTETLERERE